MAATATAHWLEWLDLASPILQEPLQIEDGYATPTDAPGSGIAWNEETVTRYLAE
jgi:mandelate racemase